MNYYEILGVSDNASTEEIKTSYRSLCKKYHPDVNNAANAPTFFRLIQEAYETLSKEDLRASYDASLLGAGYKNARLHEDSDFHQKPQEKNTFHKKKNKVLYIIVKILLLPLLPVLIFIEKGLVIITALLILLCKFMMVCMVLFAFGDLIMEKLTIPDFFAYLIFMFIFFCLQYVITYLPVGIMLINDWAKDYVFQGHNS